jgi:hypothetical protein
MVCRAGLQVMQVCKYAGMQVCRYAEGPGSRQCHIEVTKMDSNVASLLH